MPVNFRIQNVRLAVLVKMYQNETSDAKSKTLENKLAEGKH